MMSKELAINRAFQDFTKTLDREATVHSISDVCEFMFDRGMEYEKAKESRQLAGMEVSSFRASIRYYCPNCLKAHILENMLNASDMLKKSLTKDDLIGSFTPMFDSVTNSSCIDCAVKK